MSEPLTPEEDARRDAIAADMAWQSGYAAGRRAAARVAPEDGWMNEMATFLREEVGLGQDDTNAVVLMADAAITAARVAPSDGLRERLYAEIGRRLTDAEVMKQMKPLSGGLPPMSPAEYHAADNILDRAYADPDDDAAIVARAALRLAARVAPSDGLREALEQALDRMQAAWALLGPDLWSEAAAVQGGPAEGVSQALWFGMEEAERALATTGQPEPDFRQQALDMATAASDDPDAIEARLRAKYAQPEDTPTTPLTCAPLARHLRATVEGT
jgi:hypothetical protein